jgi:hypothetical protein
LYFGFSPTVSKGFEENWSASLVMVYFKTISSYVCKKLRKRGSGLRINENCFGRGHGLFHIAIPTYRTGKSNPHNGLCHVHNDSRHSIPEDLNLPWTKAGSLELLHYPPHTGNVHALL